MAKKNSKISGKKKTSKRRDIGQSQKQRSSNAAGSSRGDIIKNSSALVRDYRVELGSLLTSLEIYPGQETLLLALAEGNSLMPSELAEKLGVRPPTITKAIMRLAASGLVSKQTSPRDGRRVFVALTEKGAASIADIIAAVKQAEKAVLAPLSKPERRKLGLLLTKLNTRNEP